jgi:hypothetical protein
MIAGGTSWTRDFILWELPIWQVNEFEHCWLFEKGADVSIKADVSQVVEDVEAMKKELCGSNDIDNH